MTRGEVRAPPGSGPTSRRMIVTATRAMLECESPRERARGQHTVVEVGSGRGELEFIADRPSCRGPRSIDQNLRCRVPRGDPYRCHSRETLRINRAHPHIDGPSRRVGPLRIHNGGIVVLPIGIEVPLVAQHAAIGINTPPGIEPHGERRRPTRPIRGHHGVGRTVPRGVGQPRDRAADDVVEIQVTARAGVDIGDATRVRHQRLDLGRVG